MPAKITSSSLDELLGGSGASAVTTGTPAHASVDKIKAANDDVQSAAFKEDGKPYTKADINKMTDAELDSLGGNLLVNWDYSGSKKEKQSNLWQALAGFHGSKSAKVTKPTKVVAPKEDAAPAATPPAAEIEKAKLPGANDVLAQLAHQVETLSDPAKIETEVDSLLQQDGLGAFKLGGLLQKLSESMSGGQKFSDYVSARFGIEYRKARYWIGIYNGLLKANVAWDDISDIGWTKINILLPALLQFPEDQQTWIDKAKTLPNKESLAAAVKAALSHAEGPDAGKSEDEPKKVKNLTFVAHPDQEEVIMDAIKDAMTKANTDHKTVALELICTEYLGNTSGMQKADVALKSQVDALVADNAALKKEIEAVEADAAKHAQQSAAEALANGLNPAAFFKHVLDKRNGNVSEALTDIFGDAFDTLFPNVDVAIDVKGA